MDHKKYQNWVSGIDELSPLQKEQTQDLLSGVTGENASLMAIEAQLEETRQCPHCKASGAVSKGMARGLRRYQCKACNKLSTQQPAQRCRAFTTRASVSPSGTASPKE